MYYLIISICCSVAVSVLLKIAKKKKIDLEQAVGVNYIAAVAGADTVVVITLVKE